MHTLDVLSQVGAATKQFFTDMALERLLPLHLGGDVGVDQFDVIAEVRGVGADPAAGGTPQDGRGGGGVAVGALITGSMLIIILVTALLIPASRGGRLFRIDMDSRRAGTGDFNGWS